MRFLILFLLVAQLSYGQELKLVSTTPLSVSNFVGVDAYKNIYTIKTRVLQKDGPDGSYEYNDLQLGKITSVDIINPLKIVLFYQETNTVVFLDNKLSEIERINFNNLTEFRNVSAATNAGNNRLWLFNMDSQELELYNYRSNEKVIVSQPYPGKLESQASNFNYCFLLNEKKLHSFNIYGSLLREIANPGFEKIVQQDENLVAVQQNKLFYIPDFAAGKDEIVGEIRLLEIPEIIIKDLQLTQDFLYIYDGKNLHTFSLTLPKN